MNPCAEFLITDSRFGEPAQARAMTPRQAIAVSIEVLQPIRNAIVKRGFVVGEVTGGKPWGSGCEVGSGKSRVGVYFYPVPSPERNRWEGGIHIIPIPPFWRLLLGIRDRRAEEIMVNDVAGEMREVLKDFPAFTGVRWITLRQFCSWDGYRDEKERA